jgi:hypothetical protein
MNFIMIFFNLEFYQVPNLSDFADFILEIDLKTSYFIYH